MAKETTEFGVLIGKLINAIALSLADGKLNLQDLANFLDPIFAAQPAIEGIKLIGPENANATLQEREAIKKSFHAVMTGVPESERYDLTEVFAGVLAAYRVGYRLGKDDGEAAVIEDLKAGKIDINDFRPDAE